MKFATNRNLIVSFGMICLVLFWTVPVDAARIKDITSIQGVRANQLVGYGLVVGLDGSGDGRNATFTIQSLASMLEKMGVTVDPDSYRVKNVAAVMVTAELPAFARAGSRVDVQVSSIGDAKTLQGGTLLLTPLRAVDGMVYAIAQGAVSTGGFVVAGAGAAITKNHPTVARIAGGAFIEREIAYSFEGREHITLTLHRPDFTTAMRIADAVNGAFVAPLARTKDAGTIEIDIPDQYADNMVQFVALMENLGVTPDAVSKVVINERTGTVVMGENVRISTVAIAHGNLTILIKESADVSQALPFAEGGETVVTPDTMVIATEERSPLFLVEPGTSLGEVVGALNAIGVSPRDLISVLQALKAAGALQSTLEIM